MKPIDALTSVPRSVDASRVLEERVKNGEIHMQVSQKTFSKELDDRRKTVNESPKTDKTRIETESRKKRESFQDDSRQEREKNSKDDDAPQTLHPVKGKILDIRGA